MFATVLCFLLAAATFGFSIYDHRKHLRIVLVNPTCPVKMDIEEQLPKILFWLAGSIFLATGITRTFGIKTLPMILLTNAICLVSTLIVVNVAARLFLTIERAPE